MPVSFPDDDWFPEDNYDNYLSDFAEVDNFLNMDEADINAAVAMFSQILGATPDGVPPYEEG